MAEHRRQDLHDLREANAAMGSTGAARDETVDQLRAEVTRLQAAVQQAQAPPPPPPPQQSPELLEMMVRTMATIAETVTTKQSPEKWGTLKCWTAPPQPDELSVSQYVFQINRELATDPLRSQRQAKGDRAVNEKLLNAWSHCGWYRMMREEERERLFGSDSEGSPQPHPGDLCRP
jgi:hypothetical protein